MKKTNKKLAVLSALGLFLMSGITFVACDKDNTEPANDSRTEVVTEKSANANIYELAKDAMVDICEQIDAAYAENPELFRTVCESEDIEAFMNLTGITEEEIENYATLVNTACDMYIAENPGLDNETNAPCSECLDNILSNIYTKTLQTNGELSTTVNELDDTVIVALEIDCPEKCGKKYQDDDIRLGLCIFFCGLIDIIL